MAPLFSIRRCGLLALLVSFLTLPAYAANWSVNRVNHALVTPPAGVTIAEMSGVTYVGPVDGAHRFIAVEETKGELVQFDLTFNGAGGITSISSVAAINIVPTHDFEGIAFTNPDRNSVFLASETGAHLREISLATGAEIQTVAVPALFNNRRGNLGFESLTKSVDGTILWTANEEALAIDGPRATATAGTTVRLLKLSVADNVATAGPQYAYHVESIHAATTFGTPQSGLSDLALLPDGTLLALERSVAVASPIFLNRIYEVDFRGATDVSVPPFAAGLQGQTFAPVAKSLVWSGAVDAALGQNMEGLALGPRLSHDTWSLIGVVDNGDGSSGNTVVAFTTKLLHSADFNGDGVVDGADFLRWQQHQGTTAGATLSEGDANLDGAVDEADLKIWRALFGGAPTEPAAVVPEPETGGLLIVAATAASSRKNRR